MTIFYLTYQPEVEPSRTHFEVLGLETSSPRKLACPRREDSTIFWIVKILWSAWKIFWKTFFVEIAWKIFVKTFFFFFGEHLRLCLWPWPRALCPRLHLWYQLDFSNNHGLGFTHIFMRFWKFCSYMHAIDFLYLFIFTKSESFW